MTMNFSPSSETFRFPGGALQGLIVGGGVVLAPCSVTCDSVVAHSRKAPIRTDFCPTKSVNAQCEQKFTSHLLQQLLAVPHPTGFPHLRGRNCDLFARSTPSAIVFEHAQLELQPETRCVNAARQAQQILHKPSLFTAATVT